MTVEFRWVDIYQDFQTCKIGKYSEHEFQNRIYSIFRYYFRWQNNIVAEESIPIGSVSSIRPDFVLYKDGMPQIVIELKEPNHTRINRDKEQLFSYMRQKKVDFGLYIGSSIELYFDVPTDAEPPIKILSLDYCESVEYGDEFVRLFNYEGFDKNTLRNFCLTKIEEIRKMEELENEIKMLTSPNEINLLSELLKAYYSSKGYGHADTDYILKNIELSAKRKTVFVSSKDMNVPIPTNEEDKKLPGKRGRTRYSINGVGSFCKNGCALEIVKAYMEEKACTYQIIARFFNNKFPRFVSSEEEIKQKSLFSNDKGRRWHDTVLTSADGVRFRVTTQVGDGCPIDFQEIVRVASELGYKIEEIKNA